jgi:hypothetical protein
MAQRFVLIGSLLLPLLALGCASTPKPVVKSQIESVGPKGDGVADDSAAIQKLLDAAAGSGGTVNLGVGRFRLDRPITVPVGVSLEGVWPGPHHAQPAKGTVFLVYANPGEENGPPLITLNPSSTVKGITFFYPEQRIPGTKPYPWTIRGNGMHNNVIDCTFVNSYMAMDFATEANELHYVRNCFGCPLKVGIRVDRCTDIGRIENVHFNPHYWARAEAPGVPQWPDLNRYLWENLVAFDFARTDWEYVMNTFCYGAKVGYRFRQTSYGTVNGNFLGIGADWCERAVVVEASQPPGLLITNGEFVGGEGSEVMMDVTGSHSGVVQLSNCAFWGPSPTAVRIDGKGSVSLSQCNFLNYAKPKAGAGDSTIDARGGHLIITSCRFGIDKPDISIGEKVRTAIISGNWFNKSKEIANLSRGNVQENLSVIGE